MAIRSFNSHVELSEVVAVAWRTCLWLILTEGTRGPLRFTMHGAVFHRDSLTDG
ncbi:protein of unknown function [Burkholderia multivorans]